MTLIQLDLDAIQARVDRATAGPWCFYLGDLWRGTAGELPAFDADPENQPWPFEDDEEETGHLFHGDPVREEDAELIAHARQDVPALLDEVRRLRRELTIERLDPEDYLDSDAWSDACRGSGMYDRARHDECDGQDCPCPCREVTGA